MNKVLWIVIVCVLLSSCYTYSVGSKTFDSQKAAFNYQQELCSSQINKIQECEYFGSSIMIHIPSDKNLQQPPFLKGSPDNVLKEYITSFYKNDFEGVSKAIEKSKMFDSVQCVQVSGYMKHAKDHGFRYLLVNNGDQTYTLYDLLLSLDKTFRSPKGLDNLIYIIEDAVSKFETEQSSADLIKDYHPIDDEYSYNEKTKKGFISIKGKGLESRAWMINKIGEICSSKNVAIKSGAVPEPGYFRVTDEELKNERFIMHFESLY